MSNAATIGPSRASSSRSASARSARIAAAVVAAVGVFLVAGILALLGIKSLKKAKPVPERAIKSAKDTVDAVKHAAN